jgi:hypothetical protein
MKDRLLSIIENTPIKQISAKIKKDNELIGWVNSFHGETISEKVYNILNPNNFSCKYGNKKQFNSLNQGYKFCGRSNSCLCAKESVSQSVKVSKELFSEEKKIEIIKKRQATNIKKYGVINAAQTETSKLKHKEFYSNPDLVEITNNKIKTTKLNRYDSATYNNSDKIKETYKVKRDNKFWVNKFPEKNIEVLEDRTQLQELFNTKTIIEIADELNVHIQTVYRYLNKHQIKEPFKSADEKEIENYLNSLGITNIVRNSRKILPSKKELDFYLPDYNIAIEYNGVYWHHEDIAHITRDYHWKKFKECEEKGIQLITIFSNFWNSKKSIIKKTIESKLGLVDTKIFARKCKVNKSDSKSIKTFLNENHIQGYTAAQLVYSLEYQNEIVAVMTFSKPRLAIGNQNYDYELVRFATSKRVVGAAGKLLSAFKKDFQNIKLVSYSDNEWSTGNVYKSLGFNLEAEVKPSYWYLKPREHRLYHRYSFNKQKLVNQGYDPLKTESQITKELGLLKVWDCGKKKWSLTI